MEVLFLCGAIQAFFFTSLFWTRGEIILQNRVLIAFFLLNGLVLLDHYLEVTGIVFDYPHLLGLTYSLPIILGPILYYYALVLTKRPTPNAMAFFNLHGIPFIAVTTYFLLDYYFLSAAEKLTYYHREVQGDTSIIVYIAEFFLNLSIPFYSFLSIIVLHKHLKIIKRKFSYTEDINLRWLRLILYFFTFISVLILTTNLLSDWLPIISFIEGDNLMYASLTSVIFFMGYFGIKQKMIYPESQKAIIEKKIAYQKSGLKIAEKEVYIQQLLQLMDTQKCHLQPKLSLKDLANQMNLTENNLSQLINDGMGKNFYDFVNEYRVAEVKRQILNPQKAHLTLLGIAFESGFNSKSSFNLIFKKVTGQTPTQFKKENT